MPTTRSSSRSVMALLFLAGVSACDHTVDPAEPPMPEPSPVATQDDIAHYQELVDAVDTAATTYKTALADPALTQEGCLVAHGVYDETVRPAIGHMLGLADELEGFMNAHGGGMFADVTCTTRAMMDEVDDHNNVACMWPDVVRDRAEAHRHLGVMARYTTHAAERTEEMLTGMDAGHWNWGPLIGCQ